MKLANLRILSLGKHVGIETTIFWGLLGFELSANRIGDA
jgi:hypothetical protein